MNHISWLDPRHLDFPAVDNALPDPDGLLAAGGDLSPERLLLAYRSGIFPWYEEGQPILWWSPDPRSVLFPEALKITRSLRKRLGSNRYEMRFDTAFEQVVECCSQPREYTDGTWITRDMKDAYVLLHKLGYAHSIEAFEGDRLVGGLYGVGIGRMFFGESMFHHATDASKVALAWLCRLMLKHRGPLIDCQVESPHLISLGATRMPRREFTGYLDQYCAPDVEPIPWRELPSNLGHW